MAEGEAQAVRTRADAERYRQETVAEGEAKAIINVFNAIHEGKPDKDLIALRYLEMLPRLAENPANKLIVPLEAAGTLGALTSLAEAAGFSKPPANGGSGNATPAA